MWAALEQHADSIELVAICEVDEQCRKAHETRLAVPGYDTLGQMLEEQSLDVVVLTTPSGLRSEQTIQVGGWCQCGH